MSVKNTLEFFKIAKPNPTGKDVMTQFGADTEEVAELFEAFGFDDNCDIVYTLQAASQWAYKASANEVDDIDRLDALDAICDKLVTAVGLGYMLGMNVEGAFKEVAASNLSKFIKVSGELTLDQMAQFDDECKEIESQGHYSGVTWSRKGDYVVFTDGNGKIVKPSSYFEPDLEKFI
jgi:hypothetical protein